MSGGLHRGCLANLGSINAFERVIAEAHTEGPQFITRHGAESSHSFHHGLPCLPAQKSSLKDFARRAEGR
jgi:hypothetical protein